MAEETKDSKETKEVKQEKGMPEWIAPMIAPILSALGSMGGSYMLWIKPLQERIDFLSTQVKELQTEVRELRNEQEEYEEKLDDMRSELENNPGRFSDTDFIQPKQSSRKVLYMKKRI